MEDGQTQGLAGKILLFEYNSFILLCIFIIQKSYAVVHEVMKTSIFDKNFLLKMYVAATILKLNCTYTKRRFADR